jgi:hypothetical protein
LFSKLIIKQVADGYEHSETPLYNNQFTDFRSLIEAMANKSSTWTQFEWITGGDAKIKHERKIDVGASGEVHKVLLPAKSANQAIVGRAVFSQSNSPGCTELTMDSRLQGSYFVLLGFSQRRIFKVR